MKQIKCGLALMTACLLLAACASTSAEPQPPDIAYGQDLCAECGMIISDAEFAAALIPSKGEPLKFDDIGDMAIYHLDHPDTQPKAWFVHDYPSAAWMRGETAFYVMAPPGSSPMGSGLVAFAERSAAEKFAAERSANVLTFDEMRVLVHEKLH